MKIILCVKHNFIVIKDIIFIVLGETALQERIGAVEVRFIPYQTDPAIIARYYQAADVYMHAAQVETFGNTIVEALACGTPVVATAVGAIPELIEESSTGFLVPPKDADMMASRIVELISDQTLSNEMGIRAAKAASARFSLERLVSDYLNWYKHIVKKS